MKDFRNSVLAAVLTFGLAGASSAVEILFCTGPAPNVACTVPQATIANLRSQLAQVAGTFNGGIFTPKKLWWAVVDRKGVLCNAEKIVDDTWPDGRPIAIAKAGTANGFSNDRLALSTANLYAAAQPGGLLYGLNNSNPFNPDYLPQETGVGCVPGGIITFGGGVALYEQGQVIGGLGVSGDTPCAEHAIAYQTRALAGLGGIPVPVGAGLPRNDDIIFPAGDRPPTGFQHPRCRFPALHGKHGHGKDDHDKDDHGKGDHGKGDRGKDD
jgi:uncharacterized protein GlcG (DUF336 family)